MLTPKETEKLIENFDKFSYYLDDKIKNDINENRKGQFTITLKDENGNFLEDAYVSVKQLSHEFKFGATLFCLDFFEEERQKKFNDCFKKIFNYGVAPLYWDTLEPIEGKPRFSESSPHIDRRPPLDLIADFARKNNIRLKGHCLMYNSFQPDWISEDNRQIKIQAERRAKELGERYGNIFEDMDIINEMISIYKNCYKGNGARNLQLTDSPDYEKFSFEIAKKHFPFSKKFWNEGMEESLGTSYIGTRSFYYMTIEKFLREHVEIDGIGIQYHAFNDYDHLKYSCNPLRIIDAFNCYGNFNLPIQMSEVSIPSYNNSPYEQELQSELTKRLYKLWFGRKNCEGIVWWNLADETAYMEENAFHAGLIDKNCEPKPVYKELDKLINHEWKTTFETKASNELRFSGFYGEYEITVQKDGKSVTKKINLKKDNTGFDNRLCDFRSKDFIFN